jgi:hypothetical protein
MLDAAAALGMVFYLAAWSPAAQGKLETVGIASYQGCLVKIKVYSAWWVLIEKLITP